MFTCKSIDNARRRVFIRLSSVCGGTNFDDILPLVLYNHEELIFKLAYALWKYILITQKLHLHGFSHLFVVVGCLTVLFSIGIGLSLVFSKI